MKKLLWVTVLMVGIPLLLIVATGIRVYAAQDLDGLEAFSMALQAIISIAQYGMENIIAIVGSTQGSIIQIFGIVW